MKKTIIFLSGLLTAVGCVGQGLVYNEIVKDIDGNLYNTVTIGDQVWTVENLRTTRYNDGTPILFNPSVETWGKGTTGKYAFYANSEDNNLKTYFGALYNWYAVSSQKLAPKGWHVPTDEEWDDLQNFLVDNGYNYDGLAIENKIAKSMASKANWTGINLEVGTVGHDVSTNNKSGFSGYPAGMRMNDGKFDFADYYCAWWSSTESSEEEAYIRILRFDKVALYNGPRNKLFGLSVRLIKDTL
jgi:uncharacterized protein (TIGR02145 family)